MGFLEEVRSGVVRKPRKTFIYGFEGIGKSSLALSVKNHIVMDVEDSTESLAVTRMPARPTSWVEVLEGLDLLIQESHPFRYLFIDTIDWVEKLMWSHLAGKYGKATIDDVKGGYGLWKREGLELWRSLLAQLDILVKNKKMMIVLLGHAIVEKYTPPGYESYDKYSPSLESSKGGGKHCDLLKEWCDELFFMDKEIFVRKQDTGNFGKTINIAAQTSQVVFHTCRTPTYDAKNRIELTGDLAVALPPHGLDTYITAIKAFYDSQEQNTMEEQNNG